MAFFPLNLNSELNSNLGGEPVLLWENPSPTSEFVGQTISLDLTDYAGVIIEFNHGHLTPILVSRSYLKKDEVIDTNYFGAGHAKTNEGALGRRYNINNSGVVFENAYNLSSVDNGAMIPIKIYGVKNYVVNSNLSDNEFIAYAVGKTSSATVTSSIKQYNSKYIEVVGNKGKVIKPFKALVQLNDCGLQSQTVKFYKNNTAILSFNESAVIDFEIGDTFYSDSYQNPSLNYSGNCYVIFKV